MTRRAPRAAMLDAQQGRLGPATRRALLAAGAEIAVALAPSDPRAFGERAQALREARPDLIVLALADAGDADRIALLAEAVRFGCASLRPAPYALVATSDRSAAARARALLAPLAVELAPDPRSDEGRRAVVERLRADMDATRDRELEALAERAAADRGSAVLVVAVGSDATSLVRAEAGVPSIAIHSRPLGVGSGADRIVAGPGLDRVRRWIPWSVDGPTLLERVFNRARWPGAPAGDRETAAVEIALAHEAIAHAVADAVAGGIGPALRTVRQVVLAGRLATLPAEHAVLIAADALDLVEPASISREGAEAHPLAAIVPVATARRAVVRIGPHEESVARDALYVVPIDGAVPVSGVGVAADAVAAGPLGVVIDARPRPLALPLRDAERVPAVARWFEALGARMDIG